MMRSKRQATAIKQAKANLADAKERGKEALGSWKELAQRLFTPEELAEARTEAIRMFEQGDKRLGKKNRRRRTA